MKFIEFVKRHVQATGSVISYQREHPGYIALIRLWNTSAMITPKVCDDFVIWSDASELPEVIPNPFLSGNSEQMQQLEDSVGIKRNNMIETFKESDSKSSTKRK